MLVKTQFGWGKRRGEFLFLRKRQEYSLGQNFWRWGVEEEN